MFRKNFAMLVIFLIILWMADASAVLAEGGDQASSPGVSGQKPLSYLGTALVNGGSVDNATNIPLNPSFKLQFDKNVVNSLFWENNSKCFSMKSDKNENVPIKVSKIDDTVDFSQRQYIFVTPVNPLQPGTSYHIIVSPNLQAKNGVSTLGGTTNGQGVTITFKTMGEAVQQPLPSNNNSTPPANANPPANNTGTTSGSTKSSTNTGSVEEKKSSPASSTQSQRQNQPETKAPDVPADPENKIDEETTPSSISQSSNENDANSNSNINWLAIIGGVLVVSWIAVEAILKKRRNLKK